MMNLAANMRRLEVVVGMELEEAYLVRIIEQLVIVTNVA